MPDTSITAHGVHLTDATLDEIADELIYRHAAVVIGVLKHTVNDPTHYVSRGSRVACLGLTRELDHLMLDDSTTMREVRPNDAS